MATQAHAGDGYQWRRVVDVDRVKISVHYVSNDELARKAKRDLRDLRAPRRGYAILRRLAGRFVCDVYVTERAGASTLAHEFRHCYGWQH